MAAEEKAKREQRDALVLPPSLPPGLLYCAAHGYAPDSSLQMRQLRPYFDLPDTEQLIEGAY